MQFSRLIVLLLALILSLSTLVAAAQRDSHPPMPDPTNRGNAAATPSASPVAGGNFTTFQGCEGVVDYSTGMNARIDDAGAFTEFLVSDDDPAEIDPADAEDVVAEGTAMLEDLAAMPVPESYLPAHEGTLLFLQYVLDLASFYGVDSSSVPNVNSYDIAMAQIYDGETALATECPDEVDEAGGYIMFDPATLEDEYGD